MKPIIVKQFEDHDQYLLEFPPPNSGGTWYWGLSNDAELWFLCPTINSAFMLAKDAKIRWKLSTLKKIIKHFGHLEAFL